MMRSPPHALIMDGCTLGQDLTNAIKALNLLFHRSAADLCMCICCAGRSLKNGLGNSGLGGIIFAAMIVLFILFVSFAVWNDRILACCRTEEQRVRTYSYKSGSSPELLLVA